MWETVLIISFLVFFVSVVVFIIYAFKKNREKMKPWLIISLVSFVVTIASSLGIPDSNKTIAEPSKQDGKASPQAPKSNDKSYTYKFNPKIKTECDNDAITVSADVDLPDGALIEIVLIKADFSDTLSSTQAVKNKRIYVVLHPKDTTPASFAGTMSFRFGSPEVVQPYVVKAIYGEHGEKLIGKHVGKGADGAKNAIVPFTVDFPSKAAIKQHVQSLFQSACDNLVTSSGGIILRIEHPNPGLINVYVSNQAWYLSTPQEKDYFAQEIYKTMYSIVPKIDGTEVMSLTIYDENLKSVASSKLLGGMEVEQ